METFNVTNEEYNNFQRYILDNRIITTEAEFYELPCQKQLLKHFFCLNDQKYKTLQALLEFKKNIGIEELIFPNALVKINNNLEGCTIDKIDGTNLSLVLANQKINIKEKINYLKQVGFVLEKIKNLRKIDQYNSFFINDLHEDNCIISKNGKLCIIDLDSSKIYEDDWYPSKYLCKLRDSKLKKYKDNAINQDTDYYCYNIMILNFLLKRNVQRLSDDEFNQYLEYLYKIGIHYDLVNSFANIYVDKHNINPYKLLDSLDERVYQANYPTFKVNQKNLTKYHF